MLARCNLAQAVVRTSPRVSKEAGNAGSVADSLFVADGITDNV